MSTANPEPYSERIRLAEIIADARKLLADGDPAGKWPSYCGRLEAVLMMMTGSAAEVLHLSEPAWHTEPNGNLHRPGSSVCTCAAGALRLNEPAPPVWALPLKVAFRTSGRIRSVSVISDTGDAEFRPADGSLTNPADEERIYDATGMHLATLHLNVAPGNSLHYRPQIA